MLPTTSFVALLAATGSMAAAVLPREGDELPCMEPSLNFEKWTVSEFKFNWSKLATTPAHVNANAYVSFAVDSPALSRPIQCSAHSTTWPTWFVKGQWHSCEGTIVTNMMFSYDSTDHKLEIVSAWQCDATRFDKSGNADVPIGCTTKGIQQNPDWKQGSNDLFSTEYYTCTGTEKFDVYADAVATTVPATVAPTATAAPVA